MAWTWRLCVCSREHLLTRPYIGTPPAPPTVAQIQCFEEIYKIFQYCFTLVRNTQVPRHFQETLAQLRCSLLELSHLVMCSLAYGKLFDISQTSENTVFRSDYLFRQVVQRHPHPGSELQDRPRLCSRSDTVSQQRRKHKFPLNYTRRRKF